MTRGWPWLVASLLASSLASCGGEEAVEPPVIQLDVEPPVGAACIGVSGFEIEVVVDGAEPRTAFLQRSQPVLSRDACTLDRPSSFGAIDLDAPVQVTVRGYDGARQLRVQGIGSYVSLRDASSLALALEPASAASLPIVAIDRQKDLLSGGSFEDVERIELSVQGQQGVDVVVDEGVRPYFSAGEPWAVAYAGALVEGDMLTAKATLRQGGVVTGKLTVALSANGDYFVTSP